MLRGHRAAIAGALAVVAAAAVTAGCGGGSSSSTHSLLAVDPVAAAATKSQNAGAARIRYTIALRGPQALGGRTLRMRGTGAIDGTSSEMTFKLASMLGQMGIPAAAKAKLAHASMKAITLEQNGDYVMFMRLGFLSSQLPGGKQWIKLDVSQLGKAAGLDMSKLLSGGQIQPTDLLAMLKGEGAKIRKVGSTTIGGLATTHYRVTIDLAKELRSTGLKSPLLSGAASKLKTLSENVWIGTDGLVRRVASSYRLNEGGKSLGMSVTMDIYDYGAHLTIAAPPSSQVFDATQLAQSGIGSSSFP